MEVEYRIADEKGMLIGDFEANCPATEFIRWVEYYRRKEEAKRKEALQKTVDHYMQAQICFWMAYMIHVWTNSADSPREFDLKEFSEIGKSGASLFLVNDSLTILSPEELAEREADRKKVDVEEEEQKLAEKLAREEEAMIQMALGIDPAAVKNLKPGVPTKIKAETKPPIPKR